MSGKNTAVTSNSRIICKEKLIATLFMLFISVAYLVCSPRGVDMDFHVMRIGELGKELGRIRSLKDFPIYMYRDVYYHYGYPIPIFYCALFLYPFAALVWCGLEAVLAYKIMVLTLLWVTFFVCKYCVVYWSNDKELAFRIAFIYAVQPYFLMDLFVKASIGEAFAFLFVPVIVLGYMLISKRYDRKKDFTTGIILLTLGMNGVICSHVISTIMIVCALVVVFAVDMIKVNNRSKVILGSVMAALLCAGLSLWYILPMLEQLVEYTYHGQIGSTLSHAPQNLFALFIPMHVSIALSAITGRDIPLSEVGGAPIVIVLAVVFLAVKGKIRSMSKKEILFLTVFLVLSALMCVGFIWSPVEKIFGFMQFTWRIYFIGALAGTAFMAEIIKRDSQYSMAVVLITIVSSVYVLITCFGYFFVRDTLTQMMGKDAAGYEYQSETTDILYVPQNINPYELGNRERTVTCSSEDIVYEYQIDDDNGKISVSITENNSSDSQVIHVPYMMYEGYSAINADNGKRYDIIADEDGMVSYIIPPYEVGNVIIRYNGTWIQKVSLVISLIMACIVLGMFIFVDKHDEMKESA
ncbi:hypothetical protein [Butyrivibrio sp. VCB2006]|uniref:hypothetical protein n=1 Tax=Butyrivibrio sp. VCB2006 TaxID=1280679 RepID=UPI0012DF2E88|nr:hypothetical protein [Butyrivibrio sp. VCB2006]